MDTSPLICSTNQWTGFCKKGPFVLKVLKSEGDFSIFVLMLKVFVIQKTLTISLGRICPLCFFFILHEWLRTKWGSCYSFSVGSTI